VNKNEVMVWAPFRIDAGGTWDIKALALPYEAIDPVTLNIALSVGVKVKIEPFYNSLVNIGSLYYPSLQGPLEQLPFHGPLGLFAMCLRHFQLDHVKISIKPDLPPGSALGGSSAALVALINGIVRLKNTKMDPASIVTLAYHLEDIFQRGGAGMQDHLAAQFGGVNLWHWHYSTYPFFSRETIPQGEILQEMEKRILVAYTGFAHFSPGINKGFIEGFMEARERNLWKDANAIIKELWQALKAQKWEEAGRLLNEETGIRARITKEAVDLGILDSLLKKAKELGCGARFTGAGGGGCVWAIGEKDRIQDLKKVWGAILDEMPGARFIFSGIEREGVKIILDYL